MSEAISLIIEFPNIDFNIYSKRNSSEVEQVFQAYLYEEKGDIILKIIYDYRTYFDDKFMSWVCKIEKDKFGSYTKTEISSNNKNEELKKIDLSDASLIHVSSSTAYFENGKRYILIKLNKAKFYWNPHAQKNNSAEFYLHESGAKIVHPYYASPFENPKEKKKGIIKYQRVKGLKKYYKLGKISFRPEYRVEQKENLRTKDLYHIKLPVIHFKNNRSITEIEALFYGDVVATLAAFYYHHYIGYIKRIIYLPDKVITINSIENYHGTSSSANQLGFEQFWTFDKFLKASWKKKTIKNISLITKTIKLIRYSKSYSSNTSFLVLLCITHIFDPKNYAQQLSKLKLSKQELKSKQEDDLNMLLGAIEKKHLGQSQYFYEIVLKYLQNKSMNNKWIDLINSGKKSTKKLPPIYELEDLIHKISQENTYEMNYDTLFHANNVLYKTCRIIVLNLLGIKNFNKL